MSDAVIVEAVRSPGGRYKSGGLAATRGDEIGIQVMKGLLARVPELKPEDVDDVIVGCSFPEGEQGMNLRPGHRHGRRPADHDVGDDGQPFLLFRPPVHCGRDGEDPGGVVRGDYRRRLRDHVPYPHGREHLPSQPRMGIRRVHAQSFTSPWG